MAKSKIIKEFASNKINLEVALKQLKLLLVNFDRKELVEWVNHELQGYPASGDGLPKYRILSGFLKGSFLNHYTKLTNVSIPLVKNTPKEILELCSQVPYNDGIPALMAFTNNTEDKKSFVVQLPGDLLPFIQHYSAISMTCLLSAYIQLSEMDVYNILSTVENKVLDILLLLEKEFGCLDELDINFTGKSEDEIKDIESSIFITIFDNSVHIGDKNKISNSNVMTASNMNKGN